MAQHFLPSWINVLDEPMMEWFNKWDPVFMCIVRKPYPFGNERHTICYAVTSILWRAHTMEGKDRSNQISKNKWEELGNTVGIILRMYKPRFSTGKCVVLDSGFCVSKGIIALLEFGVYAAALIKKHK